MSQKEIIIDTGYLLALFNPNDLFHEQAIKLNEVINKRKWITTWPVLTETCHLLINRKKEYIASNLFKMCEMGGMEIFNLSQAHVARIAKLFEKYQSLPMDLADASLIILAEELGHGDIVSTDRRDFNTYRWKNHLPFRNLLN